LNSISPVQGAAQRLIWCSRQGRVLCEGSVDQVQQDARVREVYLGRSGSKAAAHA
jgi:ABC-type uncharacterized transport system ATPase subunit